MRKLRELVQRFAGLFDKQRKDRELEEEIESHLQLHIEDSLRLGMTPEEARRQALIKLGGIESTKEAYRDQRGLPVLETLWQDIRYSARMLRKNPGFTAVAVLTLALGIGATTAIVSVVRIALFDPLPMAHPEQFVRLSARNLKEGWSADGLNPIAAREVEAATNLFRTVALSDQDSLRLEGGEYPMTLGTFRVSEGFFRLANVRPLLGRLPAQDEFGKDAAKVLVLGHDTWQALFNANPALVGSTLRFHEGSFTVLGVMPPEFRLPSPNGGAWVAWSGPDARPGDPFPPDRSLSLPGVTVQAELQPGVAIQQAQAWLDVLQARQAEADAMQKDFRFVAENLSERFSKPELRRTLWALLAMTVIVLLIASANLANLQLVRTEMRQRELAMRAALGAGRGRVFRQLFAESLVLAAIGGAAGLLVTSIGLDALTKLLPGELPRLRAIRIDGGVLAVAMLVTLGTSLLFGVAPAWRGRRTNLSDTMKLGGSLSTSRERSAFGGALVVAQVALAFLLLAGAGLLVRSVHKLLNVDVGFDPRRAVRLYPPLDLDVVNRIRASGQGEAAIENYVRPIYDELRRRLAALPGVEAVGVAQPAWGKISAGKNPGAATLELAEYRIGV